MGFLNKLFGSKKENEKLIPDIPRKTQKLTEKEIFESPSKLAEWVDEYIIQSSTVEDDFDSAPDENARKKLNITYEQVERLAREEGLLRAVGASFLVKQHYDDLFYLKYLSSVYKAVSVHMYSDPSPEEIRNTQEALNTYVNSIVDAEDGELKDFQAQYIHRIYVDNDNLYKLMLAGIGSLAIKTSLNTFELMRDAYFEITQGMSYESTKIILEAMEKVESDS